MYSSLNSKLMYCENVFHIFKKNLNCILPLYPCFLTQFIVNSEWELYGHILFQNKHKHYSK